VAGGAKEKEAQTEPPSNEDRAHYHHLLRSAVLLALIAADPEASHAKQQRPHHQSLITIDYQSLLPLATTTTHTQRKRQRTARHKPTHVLPHEHTHRHMLRLKAGTTAHTTANIQTYNREGSIKLQQLAVTVYRVSSTRLSIRLRA